MLNSPDGYLEGAIRDRSTTLSLPYWERIFPIVLHLIITPGEDVTESQDHPIKVCGSPSFFFFPFYQSSDGWAQPPVSSVILKVFVVDGIISIFQVLPVIWRSLQDLCIHPFTGHPCFRSNQLNYWKNYFFFLCVILKRKITTDGTFFIFKFELSLLFEKLFVFTRWRAKSTSW